MPIVIDASAVARWLLPDEESPASQRLLERIAEDGGVVPALWRWEVANLLLAAERRGRIDPPKGAERLQLLGEFPIEVDAEAFATGCSTTLALARAERLTAYDAAYLELAIRRKLALATKDKALILAARRHRLELVDA